MQYLHEKGGLGIGISYVNMILRVNYGDRAKIDIESKLGSGTAFIIEIPYEKA
ncbi:MAG: hypothetical protein Q7J78_06585 [Clostridiales bacterium]|nr:hypothetical protein [Clostridiales bacterium]